MATGTWDDFTSKYGFSDGEAVEERDFAARKRLVAMLNGLPGMKAIRALEYDRPGVHNPCLVVLLSNPDKKGDRQLLRDWKAGKVGSVGLPEASEDLVHALVRNAYAKARRRR